LKEVLVCREIAGTGRGMETGTGRGSHLWGVEAEKRCCCDGERNDIATEGGRDDWSYRFCFFCYIMPCDLPTTFFEQYKL
jgi:hypothetical protein